MRHRIRKSLRNGIHLILLSSAVILYSLFLFFTPVSIASQEAPFHIYSNQLDHPLEKTVLTYIENAKFEIVTSTFGETDPNILNALEKKANEGLDVTLHYDAKSFPEFPHTLLPFNLVGHREPGLMHQKILAIDRETTVLGSTNWTPTSFAIHDNLLFAVHSPRFTEQVIEQLSNSRYSFPIEESFQDAYLTFWSLPGTGKPALASLLHAINQAKISVDGFIFTFTHPKIVEALGAAMRRGVKVTLTVDKKNVRGTSKMAVETLRKKGATIYINNHRGLMHHKMGWIDEELFFFGSANWTKSAFEKNRDYLVCLSHLSPELKSELKILFKSAEKYRILYRPGKKLG